MPRRRTTLPPNGFLPMQLWLDGARLWQAWAETWVQSAMVIGSRSMLLGRAMLPGGRLDTAEATRMIVEKQRAMLDSAAGALRPYHRATRSNVQRLGRRRRNG